MTDTVGAGHDSRDASRPVLVPVIVVVLLGQMAVAMLLSAANDSPTFDEPAHIASGIAHTKLNDLNFFYDHPPFVRLLSSLPYRFLDIRLPPGPSEVERVAAGETLPRDPEAMYGNRLLYESGNDANRVLWRSRLPLIVLTLLFALVVFGFARDLFGNAGALLALAVATLTPDLIAHGRLVTNDVAVSGAALAAVWFLWRAANRRSVWVVAAGLAFGVALASKYSALVLVPPIVGLAALGAWGMDGTLRNRIARAVVWGIGVPALALVVVWGTYLAADPRLRFDQPTPKADSATGPLASLANYLPVPEPYRAGVRFDIADQARGRVGFLFGERYVGGKVHFYPAVLAIKTPIGILVLWVIGLIATFSPRSRRHWPYLVVAPAFVLVSAMVSGFNIGVRHVLVVPLFLAVATGAVMQARLKARVIIVGFMVIAAAVSVWRVFPSYLAYANEAFGGPDHLHRLVADSNIDWGQDLRRLAEWMRRNHQRERVAIQYFGTPPISHYGFNGSNSWDLLTEHPAHVDGLVAISATYVAFPGQDEEYLKSIGVVGDPIATIGHSILIYRGR